MFQQAVYDNQNTMDDSGNHYPNVTEDTLIVPSDVKFNNAPLEEKKKLKKRRRIYNEAELINKQQEQEEYNREAHEQRYKRLMHLLNKSQFFSSYLINKIKDNQNKKTKKRLQELDNDENIPPQKKRKQNRRIDIEKYDIQEYISTEISKQVQATKDKKNLSVNEIEAELSADSDTEKDPAEEATAENNTAVSKYFHGELYDYQKAGLEWLNILYENALSGILADEMGLGKTIQVIALICHLVEKKQTGPYLIVAPLSTIPNWLGEFKRFAPDIPVVLFYGTQEEREYLRKRIRRKYLVDDNRMQPVVLTTYEVPLHEIKFLQTQNWRYIVIDEGQRIKNYKCKLVKALKTLRSMNRLILTGTPLQNDLSELWSLLNFLMPELFDNLDTFKSWFNVKELYHKDATEKVLKQEKEKHVLSSLREILKPFMLRRLKADVCPEIPPKKELVVYAPLTELQHDLYKAVLNYDLEMLSKIERPDEIIDVDGVRPKRQCVLRKYKETYGSKNLAQEITLNTLSQEIENNNEWKEIKSTDSKNLQLAKWKQYTDVTERNRDFLVCIQTHYRIPMYKRIVNHPYLVHCPLDPTGLPKIDNDLIKSSGKLLVLDAMLAKLKPRGHKVLLFSTMTMILDMIEDYLLLRDYNYVRLDGLTKLEDREKRISAFNNDSDVFLFLISTRAGGVGLNLMSADTVIIYDSDWNPQADIQAMARCHRIGQTKPVVVYRLCTRGTIDEAIINRAEGKRILEKMVISPMAFNNKDTLFNLKKLMESKEYKVVTSEKEVFTEMELNKLLDRSDMINNHHK